MKMVLLTLAALFVAATSAVADNLSPSANADRGFARTSPLKGTAP